MPAEDLRVLVVEDRRLDGALEEVVGVAAEELVERVLAGDVDGEAAAAPAGAAPHLAQRGDGAGERDDDRGVELADVDAELQRVGRDHRAQLAADQAALQLAALLGGVAGAVGGDAARRARGQSSARSAATSLCSTSTPLRDFMKQISRAPSRTRRASSSAASPSEERRWPRASSVSGGFQTAICRPGAGEPSSSIRREVLQPGQALGQLDGVGDRGGGEQEARRVAVGGGDPAQAAQDVGDVRAEHAAVDVGLVDDDDREVREQLGPGGVVGEDADVEHVGVGEHDVRAPADVRARLARGVAVVDRRVDALGQAEGASARAWSWASAFVG